MVKHIFFSRRHLLPAGAITANPNPIFVHGEHGKLFSRPIHFRGDEMYRWCEDSNGCTLIDDPEYTMEGNTTRKVYATIDPRSRHLVSTGVRFSSTSNDATVNGGNPRKLRLKKHLMPSIYGHFCEECDGQFGTQSSSSSSSSSSSFGKSANRCN